MQADQLTRITSARRWLVRALVALSAVLAATGAYLLFFYEPVAAQAWPGLAGEDRVSTASELARAIHRWTGLIALPVSFVAAVVAVVEAAGRWHGPVRRRSGAITGPAVVLVVLVGIVAGFLLPWDQLALKVITVGTDYRGYRHVLFGDRVRFALMDGREVSVADLRLLVLVHVVGLALLLAPLLWIAHRDREVPPGE